MSPRSTHIVGASRGKDRLVISTIVIPTYNRPFALKRCLSGLFTNLSAYGRRPRIVIADGSSNRDSLSRNREIVAEFRRKHELDITLIGSEEKTCFLDHLVWSGLGRDVADFAVNGLTNSGIVCPGANRNTLLLAVAGENFLSLDDDTQFLFANADQFISNPVAPKFIFTLTDDSPVQHWLYSDRESLLRSVQFNHVDLLSCHELVLGQEPAELGFLAEKDAFSCKDIPSLRGQTGRVLITLSGVIGDCGWGTPSRFLFINKESLYRLTRSEEAYLHGITTREMAQLAPGLCLSQRAEDVMSGAFAGDGRCLFAPFFPLGRGEDVLFGQLLKRIEPDAWFGHIPYAIMHAPLENRRFWPREILRSAAATDLSSFLCGLTKKLPLGAASNANPFRKIGKALSDIAALPTAAFRRYVQDCRRASTQAKRCFLEDRLSLIQTAPSYTADVKAYIDRLLEGDEQSEAGIPVELLYGRDADTALRLTKKVLSLFGQLFCIWPDMVRASSHLRESSKPP